MEGSPATSDPRPCPRHSRPLSGQVWPGDRRPALRQASAFPRQDLPLKPKDCCGAGRGTVSPPPHLEGSEVRAAGTALNVSV